MMAAVRFAKRIGPARDRPLDANGVGGHSIAAVQSAFARLGRARAHFHMPRADAEAFRVREPY